MKKLSKKQFVSVRNQSLSTKISKNLAICFLFIMAIFSMLTLSECASTYGKAPKRLVNDDLQIKIYKSAVAKQEVSEAKLKEIIDKELTENHYADYIVLHQCDVNYRIKFFKTMQDKYAFLGNIQNYKFMDSLKIDAKCNDVHIGEQVLLFKSNNFTFENTTKSKLILSTYGAGASCNFAKGGGKYFLIMNYGTSRKDFREKHILSINLNNGAKIQLSPFPNYSCIDGNNSTLLLTANPEALSPSNFDNHIKIYNSTIINFSYKMLGFLYAISMDQL